MMTFMGIDPGVNGGIAVLPPIGKPVTFALRPDMTDAEFKAFMDYAFQALRDFQAGAHYPTFQAVWIEKVQHIKGDGAQGSFTFGGIFGMLRGFVLAEGYKPLYVPPQIWQAHHNCMSGGNKNVTKRKAIELFGSTVPKITHANADALLIAAYGRDWWARPRFSPAPHV